jgi:hypothetical protein
MSNAFQLRDASDITTFKKNRAIYQNYVQLESKGQLPIGGISHEHLMAVARTNVQYIPMSSIAPTITALTPTGNTVTYATTEVAADRCDPSCGGGAYMPETYRDNFYTS